MTWIETTSLTFTARHEDGDRSYAEDLLDRLEDLSLKLEDRFEVVPGDISIVIHPSPIWLAAAHPFLPFVRYAAAPAGLGVAAGSNTTCSSFCWPPPCSACRSPVISIRFRSWCEA